MKIIIGIVVLFASSLALCFGQPEFENNADSLYHAGRYSEARALWENRFVSQSPDPDVFLNMGHAAMMEGDIAVAILNYERALRYRPADDSLHQYIQSAREKIPQAVIPMDPFFPGKWLEAFLSSFRPGFWAILGMAFILLAVVTWLAILGIIHVPIKNANSNLAVVFFCVGACMLLFGTMAYATIHRSKEAVIITQCDFREAPTDNSPLTRILYAGEKVKISDELNGWYQVTLLNLDQGWLKKTCAINIEPSAND